MEKKVTLYKTYAAFSAWVVASILLLQDGLTLNEVSNIAAGALGVIGVYFFPYEQSS